MKILFLIRSLGIGGAERQMALLALALKNAGHDITVLSYYSGGSIAQGLLEKGIRVISLQKKSRWDMISFVFNLMRVIRREKPEVLYSFMNTSNLLALVGRFLVPNLKIIWGIRASNMDLSQYTRLSRVAFWLEKKLSAFPDQIIANSDAGKAYMTSQGFTYQKIKVVENGIDTDGFFPDPIKRRDIRQALGVSENECLIGMVARIDPMKDYPTFFRMAAILIEKQVHFRFVIMGSGEQAYQSKMETLLTQLGLSNQVIWLQEEDYPVASLYAALDIFCLSSISEGFSNVLAEAMASGLPCVATEAGDARKILGNFGRVVPIRAPEQMAKACLELLEQQPDKALIRKRMLDNFSVLAMMNKTEKILHELYD